MTIKLRPEAPRPKHRNPELKQGQTYRLVGAGSGAYQDYIGRYFTAAFCAGCTYLVYMLDSAESGGYDNANVVNNHGLEFVQVDLTEA